MKKILLTVVLSMLVMSGCGLSQDAEEVAEPENAVDVEEVSGLEMFEGDYFSFTYPAEYIADEDGLWTEDGYERHINPVEGASLSHVPYVRVEQAMGDQTVDQYIMDTYTLGSLEGMSEKVQLGDYEFTKVVVPDMLTATGYYTKKDDVLVGFVSYYGEAGDWEEELEVIAASLEF